MPFKPKQLLRDLNCPKAKQKPPPHLSPFMQNKAESGKTIQVERVSSVKITKLLTSFTHYFYCIFSSLLNGSPKTARIFSELGNHKFLMRYEAQESLNNTLFVDNNIALAAFITFS